MSFFVRLHAGAGDAAAEAVGGKARSLLRLAETGLPVPPAVVLEARLFRTLRAGGPPLPEDLRAAGAFEAVDRARAALAAAELPPDVRAGLAAELAALAPGRQARFAVRS